MINVYLWILIIIKGKGYEAEPAHMTFTPWMDLYISVPSPLAGEHYTTATIIDTDKARYPFHWPISTSDQSWARWVV